MEVKLLKSSAAFNSFQCLKITAALLVVSSLSNRDFVSLNFNLMFEYFLRLNRLETNYFRYDLLLSTQFGMNVLVYDKEK